MQQSDPLARQAQWEQTRNFTTFSDTRNCPFGIVVPGTIRDSIFVLEGLLEQKTGLNPLEIMTDTAGYSDIIFCLFWLLGYQFSPRLADAGEALLQISR